VCGGSVPSRLPAAAPTLAGFSYVRPLGAGGFADVFLYEQDMPRRAVAVKVLLEDIVDEALLRMFAAEADAMAHLSAHPSILTIYQASVSPDGRPYIVMEYCPASFASRYRRETIPVDEVLRTGVKVASALESAHRAGLLHRDIKPSNILLTAYGMPVLSDFGIAASVSAREGVEVFAMSVPWSAPEIIDERTSGSVPAEVWSLGATVYSLLAGRSPFERPSHSDNTRDHLKSRIRRAAYTPIERSDLPPGLEDVLRRALAKNPVDRFSSAAEFAHALQLVQYDGGMPVTPLELADAVPLPDREPDAVPAFVRPRVPHESPRRKRTRDREATGRAPSDDLPETMTRRRPALLWSAIIGGAIVVTGVAAAVIVSVI